MMIAILFLAGLVIGAVLGTTSLIVFLAHADIRMEDRMRRSKSYHPTE